MKSIMFSRVFPAYHPRKGEPTYFVEKVMASLADTVRDWKMYDDFIMYEWLEYYNAVPKHHTIRSGNRWKVGDFFVPKIWTGLPYRSKQIQFSPAIEVKKTWDFEITPDCYKLEGKQLDLSDIVKIAKNDGLTADDLELWFAPYAKKANCKCQIICWNQNLKY